MWLVAISNSNPAAVEPGQKAYCIHSIRPQADDVWTETNLHLFTRGDGEFPEAALLRDKVGNLYGTALLGGAANMGVVFKLGK